jgi:hypothetical protein
MLRQHLLSRYAWRLLTLFLLWFVLLPQMLFAQEARQSDPIIPDKPPLPATPVILPIPKLEIVRYYTEPAQVRAQEPFVLYLEIKNVGAASAVDYTVQNVQCTGTGSSFFISEDICIKPIPTLQVGEVATLKLHLRPIGEVDRIGKALTLPLKLNNRVSNPDVTLSIFVLPARVITDETPALQRPFSRPNLIIHRSWTAKARATVADLLTEVPLAISNTLPHGIAGGPEFELVVELQNQGQGEAANIFIDFCTASDNFNPVYSGCRKQVPTTLGPGANAIASQTLAYKNTPTPPGPAARGDKVVIGITYEFWYVDQWLRESITHEVYLYPQPFPALTPIPAAMKDKPDLVVNTPQLNVRYGPGTLYPIVGVTYQGISHEVTGKDNTGEWWQINFNQTEAWVHARYVILRGAEKVELAQHIPPPPPAQAQPAPIPQPNRDPVGASEPQATLIPVGMPPALQSAATPIPTSSFTPPASLLQVNYQEQSADASNIVGAGGRTPLIIIEQYQTMPTHLQSGQPFQLDLVLRNIGDQRVQQLLLGWQEGPIVPLATGTMRWLDDLPAGASTTITSQFMLTTQNAGSVIQLPVQILYTDEQGQLVQYTEQLTLLSTAGEPNKLPMPAPPSAARPLWVRLFFGLIGLGAAPQ